MFSDPGFRIVPSVFTVSDVVAITTALSGDDDRRRRAGARHLLGIPAVRQFAADTRLLSIAAGFIGASAFPFRATLFDKSAAANWLVVWHQDTALPLRQRVDAPGWGPWSTKAGVVYAHAPASALGQVVALRVHLDDNTDSNGPLRVLPGTHSLGVLTDAELIRLAGEVQPVDCLGAAGAVVAMRPLLVHSSSKARALVRRRVLHIEYAQQPAIDSGLELAVA